MTLSFNSPIQFGLGALERIGGLGNYGFVGDGQRYETLNTGMNPDGQVADTMPLIQKYSETDSQSPLVQAIANDYASKMPGASAAEVAWKATKDHLRFENDQVIAGKYAKKVKDFVVEVLIVRLT